MSKEDRTAIILCGGKGSRLGILGKRLPKSLVQVQNKEVVWYIINILTKNKFNHLILPTGYKGNLIKNYIKKNKFRLKLVFDGFINKVILLLITIVVLMESYQLGVLLILGFFVIYTGLQINNNQVVEGFHNYFENKV